MSSWWGNKLGTPTQRPQQNPVPQQRSPQDYLAQHQQQQVQAPQQPYTPPDPGDPYGHQKGIWNWQGNLKGGLGETLSTGACPECGSNQYFSRAGSGGVTTPNGVVYPAPECFECGYPRLQGNLGVPVSVQGQVMSSRQPMNIPMGG